MKSLPLNEELLPRIWRDVLAQAGPMLARELEKAGLPAVFGPNTLVLRFEPRYNAQREYCSEPTRVQRIEGLLRHVTGHACQLRVELAVPGPPAEAVSPLNNCFFRTENTILHDGLRFRSKAEIAIYEELLTRRLLFFPNAAAVIGGGEKSEKKEPDFLICQQGRWGILEVMGDAWHTAENAVKDHDRARLFKEFGILCIEFFDARECYSRPAVVVDKFLAILAKH
jgi:hypothetical protein